MGKRVAWARSREQTRSRTPPPNTPLEAEPARDPAGRGEGDTGASVPQPSTKGRLGVERQQLNNWYNLLNLITTKLQSRKNLKPRNKTIL